MVKFVGLVLLGFAACMAAAIPPTEDSNGHPRIRRFSRHHNPDLVGTHVQRHGNHYDQVQTYSDGSVERTHGGSPHTINNQYGYNSNYNPSLTSGQSYLERPHGHKDAIVEITKYERDEYGHLIQSHEDIYPDGHTHKFQKHV